MEGSDPFITVRLCWGLSPLSLTDRRFGEDLLVRFVAPLRARLFGCAVAFVFAALLGAGGASAAEIYPSSSPDVLRGLPPYSVTYRFEFNTGALPEQVAFSVATQGDSVSHFALDDGPAVVTPIGASLASSIFSCAGGGSSVPSQSSSGAWRLDLPPASRSTVSVTL